MMRSTKLMLAGLSAVSSIVEFGKVMQHKFPEVTKDKEVGGSFLKLVDGQKNLMSAIAAHLTEDEAANHAKDWTGPGSTPKPGLFMTFDDHPGYPYLVRGNSGAVWRVEREVTEIGKQGDIRSGFATCVLGSGGVIPGDTDTLTEQNFIAGRGGLLQIEGRFLGAVEQHETVPQGILSTHTFRASDAK